MRRFVLAWKKLGLEQRLGSRIVTYADDLVILCRPGKAEEALHWMRKIMGQLKLTVNEDKTRICNVLEGEFGKRSFNHVYPCRLKAPKIVSTYNQVDTYDGEQESFISTIGRGAAERWPLSV
jgi:hypothetical protein